MVENKNKKTFKLTNQQVVDAFAQYLYDIGELGNGESTGELVYELSENNGATVVLTVNEPEDTEQFMTDQELDRLNYQHAKLHSAIEKMLNDNVSDENKLSVMKKHKLWLKDKIQELETKKQNQNV